MSNEDLANKNFLKEKSVRKRQTLVSWKYEFEMSHYGIEIAVLSLHSKPVAKRDFYCVFCPESFSKLMRTVCLARRYEEND